MEGVTHFFGAENVDALYEIHRVRGANIISPLENKPWGIREYTVRDLNGYELRISGPEKHEKPAGDVEPFPEDVRIVLRVPSIDQYVDLFRSVGWAVYREHMEMAIQNTVVGVLAVAGDGQPVGMARITGDGMYYTLGRDRAAFTSRTQNWIGADRSGNEGASKSRAPRSVRRSLYGQTRVL